MRLGLRILLIAVLMGATLAADGAEDAFLEVGRIFERRCVGCHNSADLKGGLSLERMDGALAGGESGAAIVPQDPGSSYLLDLVTPRDGRAEMPKEGDPLKLKEVEAIRAWIAAGAVWPAGVTLSADRVADTDWWSLRPVEGHQFRHRADPGRSGSRILSMPSCSRSYTRRA